MDSELKDISKDSNHDSSGGEGSGKDMRPLLKSESSVSASPATTDTLQELEKKYAPYVRRDAYGTMGLGELPPSEKFLLGVALVTLVPVRFFAGLFILVLYYLICRICTAFSAPYRGEDEQEDYAHMTGWRRVVIVRSGQFLSRALFFVMGFYWINETYRIPPSWEKDADENEGKEPSEESEQPGAIISNHISYLDILYHMSSSFSSFVAKFFYVVLVLTFFPFSIAFWISLLKRSVSRLPLVGLMSKCLGCVFVQRESKSTDFRGVSGVVIERVQAAHHNKLAPMMMLFPEGTTTNGDFLLPFKTGAFLAKAPVLPVILRYPYQRFSPAWDSISGVRHVILLLCQFVNHIEVIRLPVYHPSQQEKDDPKLYANNVRKLMANEGNLVLSDIGLAEKRVYHAALNGNSLPSVLHQKDD